MRTGLDPEVLAMSGTEIVPASHFLSELRVGIDGVSCALSFDNAAVEMRPEPSTNVPVLITRLQALFTQANTQLNMARVSGKVPPYSGIRFIPAALIPKVALELESVCTFGCSPSLRLDVEYQVQTVVLNSDASNTLVRSAGFHVHQELPFNDTAQAVVGVLDGLLGLRDVIVNHQMHWDAASALRRSVLGYGRAGEYRLRTSDDDDPPVLEYRVLSPWPMIPRLTGPVLRTVRAVATEPLDVLMGVLGAFPSRSAIVHTIDTGDTEAVMSLYNDCQQAWRTRGGQHAA